MFWCKKGATRLWFFDQSLSWVLQTKLLSAGLILACIGAFFDLNAQPKEQRVTEDFIPRVQYSNCFKIEKKAKLLKLHVLSDCLSPKDSSNQPGSQLDYADQGARSYVLIPRESKLLKSYQPSLREVVVPIPLTRVVVTSTTILPYFEILGLIPQVKGFSKAGYIYSPKFRQALKQGNLVEVGPEHPIQIEKIFPLNPQAIFNYPLGGPSTWELHPAFQKSGILTIRHTDYLETHPLGRAEWIKFIGFLFGKEKQAYHYFDSLAIKYNQLKNWVAQNKGTSCPHVLTGSLYGGVWHVPGGKSFTARLIKDAGACYLWKDNQQTGGVPLALEEVLKQALTADVWINAGSWQSLDEMRQSDTRYSLFKSYKKGFVYNPLNRSTQGGGLDIYEWGAAHPHLVLKDLISVFHPSLLKNYKKIWYRKVS